MHPLTPWAPAPARPVLEPGSVHLWRVRLDIPDIFSSSQSTPTLSLLSPDELARAGRLRVPAKARAFIVGRARLRQILGRYLERAPAALAFAYGPHGKPALAGSGSRLQFNLAHSGAWMLLAVTAGRPVGVDLERIDSALDFAALAGRFFSPRERNLLNAAPPQRSRRTFYRLWTGKEAYLKGRGEGFSENPGAEVALADWRIRNFFVRRGYLAAMALYGEENGDIRRWTWEG